MASNRIHKPNEISDLQKEFYKSARDEIIARVKLRDQSLIAYIGIIGAYFGFVLSQHFAEDADVTYSMIILFPLPIVCVMFTFMVLQHHLVIGSLGKYLRSEINFDDASRRGDQSHAVHWDQSTAFSEISLMSYKFRFVAQAFVLSMPVLYTPIFVWRFLPKTEARPLLACLLWLAAIFEIGCGLGIAYLHIHVHRLRIDQHTNLRARGD